MSLGLDMLGVDYGEILSTVFQAAGGAVDYAKHDQEGKAAAQGAEGALAQSISADQTATNAVAKANTSAMLAKLSPSKAATDTLTADKKAVASAVAAQDQAGAAVPEEKRGDRIKAAQDAVDSATSKVSSATGSMKTVAHFQLEAAKQTLAKAKGSSHVGGEEDSSSGGGVFSSSIIGPVKLWHIVVAAVAGGGILLLRRKK